MNRKLFVATALALCSGVALSGCASFANSPAVVTANTDAAVTDTDTVTSGLVDIAKNLANTAMSLTGPISSIIATGVPVFETKQSPAHQIHP